MNRIRSWFARQVLRFGHWIDPEAADDLTRIQRYNENLNGELRKERDKRMEQTRIIREKDRRIHELEEALEAHSGKESIH